MLRKVELVLALFLAIVVIHIAKQNDDLRLALENTQPVEFESSVQIAVSANPEALNENLGIAPYSANPEALRVAAGVEVVLPPGENWTYSSGFTLVTVTNDGDASVSFDGTTFADQNSNASCPMRMDIHLGDYNPRLIVREHVAYSTSGSWDETTAFWHYLCHLSGQPPLGVIIFE